MKRRSQAGQIEKRWLLEHLESQSTKEICIQCNSGGDTMKPGMLTSLLGCVAVNWKGLKRVEEYLAKENVLYSVAWMLLPCHSHPSTFTPTNFLDCLGETWWHRPIRTLQTRVTVTWKSPDWTHLTTIPAGFSVNAPSDCDLLFSWRLSKMLLMIQIRFKACLFCPESLIARLADPWHSTKTRRLLKQATMHILHT